ncbi:MAG: nucleotide sugar dehydrogenase [Elusimicrobia bacterium]|nr:nucleotide sugar dehydrogenase [Candidatus Obscuribacterium magneticum]
MVPPVIHQSGDYQDTFLFTTKSMVIGQTMKICIFGLWHLGTVTAACLAARNFNVIGLDGNSEVVNNLNQGKPPLYEPGLEELVKQGISKNTLSFSTDKKAAIAMSDVVWITFDTPVDEDDHADVEFVENQIRSILPYLKSGSNVLISSQMPVGSTGKLEHEFRSQYPNVLISFFYSPENLRLGKAIDAFNNPARIVVGKRTNADSTRIEKILTTFCDSMEWMSVESAEMTKHALNAFLATSVTFINELSELCEQVGADAKEVERGLKSEPRIGPRAYLGPGAAFAGGTLARDIEFLIGMGQKLNIPTPLFSSIRSSNNEHKTWPFRKLTALLGSLKPRSIAVLGLTYKPGTDTLRRSSSIELCQMLNKEGAIVRAHDPAVKALPESLKNVMILFQTVEETVKDVSALVLATEWQDYKVLKPEAIIPLMKNPIIIDPSGFLRETFSKNPSVHYNAVGKL